MVKKSFSALLVAVMLVVLSMPIAAVAQAPEGAGFTVPVTGKAKGAGGGNVTGTFRIHEFVNTGTETNPVLGAVGTLMIQTSKGRTVLTQVTMPVGLSSPGAGTGGGIGAQQLVCEILELTLGPLDLNLLGLEIHLDQVHLTIDANPFGGLLGQLLCAIANLLGPGGTIGNIIQLLTLLNQLLALLGGLGL